MASCIREAQVKLVQTSNIWRQSRQAFARYDKMKNKEDGKLMRLSEKNAGHKQSFISTKSICKIHPKTGVSKLRSAGQIPHTKRFNSTRGIIFIL